jgi:hypothetical protein
MNLSKPVALTGIIVASANAFVLNDVLSDAAESIVAITQALSLDSTSTSQWSFGHPGPYTFA